MLLKYMACAEQHGRILAFDVPAHRFRTADSEPEQAQACMYTGSNLGSNASITWPTTPSACLLISCDLQWWAPRLMLPINDISTLREAALTTACKGVAHCQPATSCPIRGSSGKSYNHNAWGASGPQMCDAFHFLARAGNPTVRLQPVPRCSRCV